MSSRTRSGRSDRAAARPDAPSSASPTTSNPSASSRARAWTRKPALSSTMRMVFIGAHRGTAMPLAPTGLARIHSDRRVRPARVSAVCSMSGVAMAIRGWRSASSGRSSPSPARSIAISAGEPRERRPAPPRDRPDLPVRRAGDLGPRAGQPDRPADDPGRADLVHRDARSGRRSRSSTSSRWRSRTPPRHPARARPGVSERPPRDARRPGRGGDPRDRRDRPQRPLLDEPARSSPTSRSGLYGGLALAIMTSAVVSSGAG